MIPICYEQSLPNGPSPSCAEFIATATEQFMKTLVGSVLSKTRSNITGASGAHSISTRRFRHQLLREETLWSKGELSRSAVGNLLPIEIKEASGRRPLGLGDVRLALDVGGDRPFGQMPTVVQNIMSSWPEGVLEGWGRHPEHMDVEEDEMDRTGPRTNGVLTNGVHINGISNVDNEGWGWEGGAAKDRQNLMSLLDDCLTIGQ